MVFQFSDQLDHSHHWSKCLNKYNFNVHKSVKVSFERIPIFAKFPNLYAGLGYEFASDKIWQNTQHLTVCNSSKLQGQIIYSIILSLEYNLKLVSVIFYHFLIFHQTIVLQKLWKRLFTSSKKLFSCSRYSSFCISVSPSFSPCQPLLQRLIQDKS